MGDIQVTGHSLVPHESRGASSHVSAQDWSRLPQSYRPPGSSMARNIGLVRAVSLRPRQELVNTFSFRVRQNGQVDRYIHDPPQLVGILQRIARQEKFARARKGRNEETPGKRRRVGTGNPNSVRPCDLPTMHAEHFAQFHRIGWRLRKCSQQRRPTRGILRDSPRNQFTSGQGPQGLHGWHGSYRQICRTLTHMETGNRGRCHRPFEGS